VGAILRKRQNTIHNSDKTMASSQHRQQKIITTTTRTTNNIMIITTTNGITSTSINTIQRQVEVLGDDKKAVVWI
jgi:hypothetical protein